MIDWSTVSVSFRACCLVGQYACLLLRACGHLGFLSLFLMFLLDFCTPPPLTKLGGYAGISVPVFLSVCVSELCPEDTFWTLLGGYLLDHLTLCNSTCYCGASSGASVTRTNSVIQGQGHSKHFCQITSTCLIYCFVTQSQAFRSLGIFCWRSVQDLQQPQMMTNEVIYFILLAHSGTYVGVKISNNENLKGPGSGN